MHNSTRFYYDGEYYEYFSENDSWLDSVIESLYKGYGQNFAVNRKTCEGYKDGVPLKTATSSRRERDHSL